MSQRYVWGKYNAIQHENTRKYYDLSGWGNAPAQSTISLPSSKRFTIASTIYCNPTTGVLTYPDDARTYTSTGSDQHFGSGYIMDSSSSAIYSSDWVTGGRSGNVLNGGTSAYRRYSEFHEETYYTYSKGTFISWVSSGSAAKYPTDGYSDGYYYVLQGIIGIKVPIHRKLNSTRAQRKARRERQQRFIEKKRRRAFDCETQHRTRNPDLPPWE